MIGIVGLGHLGRALVAGLLRKRDPGTILIAPRGPVTAEFAAAHRCAVALDIQEVANRCDEVVVCVRSDQILALLRQTRWRERQLIVSACAGVPMAALSAAAGKVEIVRSLPLVSAAFGASPTLVHPGSLRAESILGDLGTVFAAADENQFDVLSCTAVLFTIGQAAAGWTASWAAAHGVDAEVAQNYSAAILEASAGALRIDRRPVTPDRIAEMATPNGLAAAALRVLAAARVPGAISDAYDAAAAIGAKPR